MIPLTYNEYPSDVPELETVMTINALEQVAQQATPPLTLSRVNTKYHSLRAAGKRVLRIVFNDDAEIATPEGMRPYKKRVWDDRALQEYLPDFLEVFRHGVLWLVDPETLCWVKTTEQYIKDSITPQSRLSPAQQALAKQLARAGGQELGPDGT